MLDRVWPIELGRFIFTEPRRQIFLAQVIRKPDAHRLTVALTAISFYSRDQTWSRGAALCAELQDSYFTSNFNGCEADGPRLL